MIIKLQRSNYDNRVINKTDISEIKSLNCTIYEKCDLIYPVIVVEYFTNITSCNYAYIPEWNRYYFITNYTFAPGQRVILNMKCDVLNSFKQYINTLNLNIVRKEDGDTNMIVDDKIIFTSETEITIFRFQNSFDSENIGKSSSSNYIVSLIG